MDNHLDSATLKKLRGPRLSADAVADLLEVLYGDGTDEVLCSEALEALPRMRNKSTWNGARVLHLILARDTTPCQQLSAVIYQLRSASEPPAS